MAIPRRHFVLGGLMASGAALAHALRPEGSLADVRPPIDLEKMVPARFADWRELGDVPVQIVDPEVQQTLDAIYSQVLTRTYARDDGYRIMLSIAYGRAQTDNLQLHLPEVCYPAQGFKLDSIEKFPLALRDRTITARRLQTHLGQRFEPVTYWTVVGDHVTASGIDKKLTEMRYGLLDRRIPDGILVRVSSIDRDHRRGHTAQARYAADLVAALDPAHRHRFAGLQTGNGTAPTPPSAP